jgi:hypothetical protein
MQPITFGLFIWLQNLEEPGEDTSKYDIIMPTIVHPKWPDVVIASAGYENSEVLTFGIFFIMAGSN